MQLSQRILTSRLWFPDPRQAMRGEHDGLVAIGGDLSIKRLLLAYRSGIFPWSVEPITWWSPDPRAIFEIDGFHVSRSFARILRQNPFTVTHNRAFTRVMEACGSKTSGRQETWISPEFVQAYSELNTAGHAHSVECWLGNELVGGVYGVAIGGFFAGESMFHRADNASKIALHHLLNHLRSRGYTLFDTQIANSTTTALGAIEISRDTYLERLKLAINSPVTFSDSPSPL